MKGSSWPAILREMQLMNGNWVLENFNQNEANVISSPLENLVIQHDSYEGV